jgi:hypothetical protein
MVGVWVSPERGCLRHSFSTWPSCTQRTGDRYRMYRTNGYWITEVNIIGNWFSSVRCVQLGHVLKSWCDEGRPQAKKIHFKKILSDYLFEAYEKNEHRLIFFQTKNGNCSSFFSKSAGDDDENEAQHTHFQVESERIVWFLLHKNIGLAPILISQLSLIWVLIAGKLISVFFMLCWHFSYFSVLLSCNNRQRSRMKNCIWCSHEWGDLKTEGGICITLWGFNTSLILAIILSRSLQY